MTGNRGIPPVIRWLVSLTVPRKRREEILSDLEDGFLGRAGRLGEPTARRHLYREAASLLLWRLRWWRGAAFTRNTAGATIMRSSVVGHDFFQDLRFGARTLRRSPGFSITAVLVLALGIGAATTVLTLVNALFFQRSTMVAEPDRIVRLTRSFGEGQGGGALANPDYLYYRENASTLQGLAAYGNGTAVAYSTGGDQHDQLDILFVSENFFDLLGVRPALGRSFLPQENATPGTHSVVMLSHDFWIRAMGGDPEVVGRTLELAGAPYTVVGVAPAGFGAVSPVEQAPDAWVPIAMYGAITRAGDMAWWHRLPDQRTRWLQGLGRLAPGVTFEAARANLVALGESLEFEGKSEDEGAFLQRQFLYSPRLEAMLTTLSTMLMVVVGIVLLVAAFNVAVLLLSRATTRYRELGIRTALGAGRGRITRQILVETLLLTLLGGGGGLVLAFFFSNLAARLLPVRIAADFRPDLEVILVAGGLSVVTALAVGLVPAFHATRKNLRGAIQGRSIPAHRSRLRDALVVGQVSLSLVLVAGALLFGRSFQAARTQELGFSTDNLLVLRVNLRELDYEGARGQTFLDEALRRIKAMPGVLDATTTRMIPFQGDWTTEFDAPPGAVPNYDDNTIFTGMNVVGPDYFRVAGIPIVRGRPLDAEDREGSPPVIVINEALAQAIWPDQDPLGKTLPMDDDVDFEVVGVAGTANYYALGEDPQPQTYAAVAQYLPTWLHFLVHTAGPAADMAPAVQATLREIDPRMVFGWVTTMASVFEDQTDRYEVSAVLVGVFSAVALLLAAAGLYGTVSFLVARRTREIGVKMALGADRAQVARDVMRFGMMLVSLGVVLGLGGAFILRRYTEGLLYRIPPEDPLPLVAACLVLLVVAAVATFMPARHATRVDPVVAMRAE